MIADPDNAAHLLQLFIATCENPRTGDASVYSAYLADLTSRIPGVRTVIQASDAEINVAILLDPRPDSPRWRRAAAMVAAQGLGSIRDAAAIQELVGPMGPRLSAKQLHPLVWMVAAKLWDGGHYSSAVQRGATAVVELVRDLTGILDQQDSQLMQMVFSNEPPTAERPRLVWPGPDGDQTVRSMRSGLRLLAPGLMQTVRNPATHMTDELSQDDGLERLAALSMLAKMIEKCEVRCADL